MSKMKIVFVRHGEPDYTLVDERGFIGMGRDIAPLSEIGRNQALALADNVIFKGAEIIVSSPYTRALQTAATLSRNLDLDIQVEVNLHEFISDKTYQADGKQDDLYHKEFIHCLGEYPDDDVKNWETITEIIARTKPVLDKYLEEGYKKIIVVAHGGIIRRYTGKAFISHCEGQEIDYQRDFECFGWV